MKLIEQRNLVRVEGDNIEETKFRIHMSAKMTRMLSDQVYSDKIKAVLRELSTNAYDSHVMAGKKDIPIEVTLPSYMSPTCVIQDFGVGLSPEQVQNVYTVYGMSDKENSNLVAGQLGLGSKVIFAYHSKTATIESVFDKKKYIYSGLISEDGMPSLLKLNEHTTSEPNGVKITIPVNKSDISNFITKAREVFEFFPVKPKIKGAVLDFNNKSEIVVSGTGWELRRTGHKAIAVMSPVSYPISFSDSALSAEEIKMMGHPFVIQFNMGDLDVEISREGLSYCLKTRSAITAKFKLIRSELADKVNKEIDACKTLWDARLKATENSTILYEYVNKAKLEWKGKKLFPNAGWHTQLELPTKTITVNGVPTKTAEKIQQYSTYYRSAKNFKPNDTTIVEISRDVKFIVRDLDKGTDSRVLLATNNGTLNNRRLYLIEPAQKQMVLDLLGCDDDPAMFILASSLPKPVPKAHTNTGTKRGNTDNVMELQDGGYSLSSYYKNVEKDLDEGGKYFEFNTFRCVYNGTNLRPEYIVSLRNSLETCGVSQKDPIYAIKTAQIKRLAKTAKPWLSYLDYAFGELDKAYSNLAYTNLTHTAELFEKFFGKFNSQKYKQILSINNLLELKKHVKQKDILDWIAKIETLQKINRQNEVRKAIESSYNNVGRQVPKLTGTPKDVKADCEAVKTTYWDILKKYPLIQVLASHENYEIKEVAIYVNAK